MIEGRWGSAVRQAHRGLLVGLLLALAPVAARAQGTDCGEGDREVRSLAFTGNRAFSSRDLALRVATTPSDLLQRTVRFGGTRHCLDSDALRLDVGRLRVYYRRQGYYSTTVDTSVTPEPDGAVRVSFLINEGEPARIDTLRITGLDSATAPLARTENLDLRTGVVFGLTRMQAAIDSIKSRLRNNGYPRADVAASYTVDSLGRHAVVDLGVIPGSQARIGLVRVHNEPLKGDYPRIGDNTVRRILGVQPGELYSEHELADAQRSLYQTDLFRNVELRLAPDSVQPKGDTLVTLDLLLRENYLRQLDTEVGWAVLDCFKERTQYVDKNFLGEARRLELTAQLSKIGYGEPTRTANGNLCASSIRDDPFSAKLNYYLGATVRLPTLFGFRTSPSLSVYSERRGEYQAYLRTTLGGGEASVTRDIRHELPLRIGYSLEYGRTEAQPALLCAIFSRCDAQSRAFITDTARILAVLGAHLERIRTDSPFLPRSGTVLRLDARTSARELGSSRNLEFVKGLADGSYYHGLTSGVTFAARLRLGSVLGRTLSFGDATGFIPPEERLYAGGANSVRGFQQNALGDVVYRAAIGPRRTVVGGTTYLEVGTGQDPSGRDSSEVLSVVPVGGNSLIVMNFELRLRSPFLPELLQYTLFTDAGDVWNRAALDVRQHKASALFLNGLRWTPGIGLRVVTPVGPFQANVGYNPFSQPAGAIYYDSPPDARGFAPLYCVSPGNGIPATDTGTGLVQDETRACPTTTFVPTRSNRFLSHLTFTFSIGPDF
jgi:outer membrane protein insertion porin family/translocation and assembly module TamA